MSIDERIELHRQALSRLKASGLKNRDIIHSVTYHQNMLNFYVSLSNEIEQMNNGEVIAMYQGRRAQHKAIWEMIGESDLSSEEKRLSIRNHQQYHDVYLDLVEVA